MAYEVREMGTLHLVGYRMEIDPMLTPAALEQKIDDARRDADDANQRNHERFDELKGRVDVLTATVEEHGKRILESDRRITDQSSRITGFDRRRAEDIKSEKERRIEATQVRFTTQQVILVSVFCASVITGPWLFNWSLRQDVSDILSTQTAQKEIVAKIQEQQSSDIKELKADGKLHTIQIQNLREEVLSLKTKGGK